MGTCKVPLPRYLLTPNLELPAERWQVDVPNRKGSQESPFSLGFPRQESLGGLDTRVTAQLSTLTVPPHPVAAGHPGPRDPRTAGGDISGQRLA